jgi:hypothetical protein
LWNEGFPKFDITNEPTTKPAENGFVLLHYGPFNFGKVKEEHINLVSETIADWREKIKEFEEYKNLEKTLRELIRVEASLKDEVAVIVLRRVVPGRCRYCPV